MPLKPKTVLKTKSNISKCLPALCFFCILYACSYSQYSGFRFENINSVQGIADRYINAIVQDKTGFIWSASLDGLTRYDGYAGVTFRHKADDVNSIPDDEVYALCTDNEGALWIGTRNGLSRYDITNNKFENFFHDEKNSASISNNEIFGLAKDKEGNIWIATYGGGVDIAKKNSRNIFSFSHLKYNLKDSNSLTSNQVFSICFDKDGNAWIATAEGLNYYNITQKKITRFFHDPENENSIAHSGVYKLFAADDGAVWACGRNILDKIIIQKSNNQFQFQIKHLLPLLAGKQDLSNWNINSFIIDKEGNGWVATNDLGLIKFKENKDGGIINIEKFSTKKTNAYSIEGTVMISFCEDSSGVIWIGTDKGISKYIPSKKRFDILSFANENNLNLNFFSAFADNQNNLWLGYDSDTMLFIQNKNGTNNIKKIMLPVAVNNPSEQVNKIFKSSKGDLYIATMREGVFVLPNTNAGNYAKKNWIQLSKKNYPVLTTSNIYSFAEDKNGFIWIGTYKGICRYNPASNTLDSIYMSPGGDVSSAYIIRSILIDDKNMVWFGTDDGLYIIKDEKILYTYKNNPSDTSSLNNDRINNIIQDHNKNIWIGTKSGINLFNKVSNKFIHFSQAQDFPQESIQILQEDNDNNVWMGTTHGLYKYHLKENKIYRYGIADGLCSEQFQLNANAADNNGFFYFGTNEGIVSFNPSEILPNNFLPPVVINKVKIMDKDLYSFRDTSLVNTYRRENKLVLRYDQNFFSFEFASLNYINSSANQYAYMLEGVDKQWIHAGTQRFAGYTDIKPGSYTLKVKGSNNDAVWNNNPVTIQIIIIPPWWQTWWFYSLCVITFCIIIYLIYRIRLKQILKLYRLRSSIAKDLHDDVGSALSSIALLSQIAQQEKTNARIKPEEIFSRIGDTSKRMIDLMDDIVWSVNPDNDRFNNMLVRMREYTVEMLEAKNIQFSFKVSEDIDELKIPMQMRKDYFLIFKEAINNLAKYSECSNASISIERSNRNIITSISDDGKGFDAELIRSGNGLKNMYHRASSLKGTLEIKTKKNQGTHIVLNMHVA